MQAEMNLLIWVIVLAGSLLGTLIGLSYWSIKRDLEELRRASTLIERAWDQTHQEW